MCDPVGEHAKPAFVHPLCCQLVSASLLHQWYHRPNHLHLNSLLRLEPIPTVCYRQMLMLSFECQRYCKSGGKISNSQSLPLQWKKKHSSSTHLTRKYSGPLLLGYSTYDRFGCDMVLYGAGCIARCAFDGCVWRCGWVDWTVRFGGCTVAALLALLLLLPLLFALLLEWKTTFCDKLCKIRADISSLMCVPFTIITSSTELGIVVDFLFASEVPWYSW